MYQTNNDKDSNSKCDIIITEETLSQSNWECQACMCCDLALGFS